MLTVCFDYITLEKTKAELEKKQFKLQRLNYFKLSFIQTSGNVNNIFRSYYTFDMKKRILNFKREV